MKINYRVAMISAAIFIAGIAVGRSLHSENQSVGTLAERAKCAKDGADFVAQQYTNIPPEYNVKQNYAFDSEMNTCLVDIQRQTNQGLTYSIYDIYANKEIAGYAEYNPEYRKALGLATSSEMEKDSKSEYLTAEKKYFSR